MLRPHVASRDERLTQGGVVTDSAHGRSQRGDVTGCGQYPVDVVGDDLGRATGIRRDHRHSGGHALDHHLAEGLGDERAVHEQVDLRKLGPDVLPEAAEHDAVADPESPRLGMEGVGVAVLAEHGRTDDPGLALIVGEGACEGLQEDVLAFPRGKAPEDPDPERTVTGQGHRCGSANRVVDDGIGDDDAPTRDWQRPQRGLRIRDDGLRNDARPQPHHPNAAVGR